MSLKGSLQTVALPEVLQLLADTSKSGELHVRDSGRGGRLWFEEGSLAGFAVAGSSLPHEAIFELLRIDDGEFDFAAEEVRPEDASIAEDDERDVNVALERAQGRLAEWREIVAVVPSLDHHVELMADPPSDEVIIARDQWTLVVAIGEGRSVGDVIGARGLGEFDGCGAVRDLVEAGLAAVSEPRAEAGLAALVALPTLEASDEDETHDEMVDEVEASPVEPGHSEEQHAVEEAELSSHEVEDTGASEGHEVADRDGVEDHYSHEDHEETDDDRYAALKSLIVEVDHELAHEPEGSVDGDESVPMPAFGEPMPSSPVVDEHGDATDGRAALQALLAEVSAQPLVADDGEPVDGLADRGPWQAHELTAFDDLGGWDDDQADHSHEAEPAEEGHVAAIFEPVFGAAGEGHDETASESEDPDAEELVAAPAEEPINRGLLLKFLSSVRN